MTYLSEFDTLPTFYKFKKQVPLAPGQVLRYDGARQRYWAGPPLPTRPRADKPSPDDPATIATKAAEAILGPQREAVNTAFTNQGASLQAAYNALAELQKQVAPAIEQSSDAAEARQAVIAKGFSDGYRMESEKTAAELNPLLDPNSPQQIQSAGAAGADVLFGLGGAIPANTLNQQGAAFANAARFLPGQSQQLGLDALKSTEQARIQAIREIEAQRPGLIQQREDALRRSGLEERELRLRERQAREKNLQIFGSAEAGYYTFDSRTGRMVQVVEGVAPTADVRPFQAVEVGGKSFVFDPNTGVFFDPATGAPTAPTTAGATPKAIGEGWATIRTGKKGWWALQSSPDEALSSSELRQIAKEAGRSVGDLGRLTAEELDEVGVAYYRAEPQELYLDLIRELGIPARKAWSMVRKEFPKWGEGFFKGGGNGSPSTGGKFLVPLPGGVPRSAFLVPDPEGAPSSKGGRFHAAVDWFARPGSLVAAPADGVIVEVRGSRGNAGQVFGGTVKLKMRDGRVWVFRHVDPFKLRVGQKVQAGTPLAGVTHWADNPSSSHAHVELWKSLAGGYRLENLIDPSTVF